MTVIAYALQIFNLIEAAVKAGMSIDKAYDLIKKYKKNLKKMEEESRGPSEIEWDEINQETEELRSQSPDVNAEE